ncbi:hypothetical protein PR003_g4636 [Phytophthora rubi]|uniref:RxLR effector protein n=1 Tax=Phytophthora rubi TaxID=129364 RepID=A0A6A3NG02_9STRA|nr:hypothetical protein PR002_g5878 [Phytophthora rubi]KAE9044326.1 hypothetical protein PR001_g5406 [Phytophthora rubi]KAE9351936.1 hypothetical protein PR003_g4636 [Phytophthora rubi]
MAHVRRGFLALVLPPGAFGCGHSIARRQRRQRRLGGNLVPSAPPAPHRPRHLSAA